MTAVHDGDCQNSPHMVKCKEDREKVQTRKPQKRRVGKLRNGLIAGEVPCICGGGQSTARKRTRVCLLVAQVARCAGCCVDPKTLEPRAVCLCPWAELLVVVGHDSLGARQSRNIAASGNKPLPKCTLQSAERASVMLRCSISGQQAVFSSASDSRHSSADWICVAN
ncbi:hypothetical protein PC119_g7764 [Phytophthora cactorum]|uniref:Uncharacterized protein n=2 Tax=Phytophthora cactorum TaxID=29920 RepID=A0A8T1DYD9_9STRA|nr:hypothetical protein PC117_g8111 [Phytophthora cactorum]KAG3026536.1 hypothetical protein PC119_g7764 [Phytophthora cactorum]KAG3090870.1 hypothetical protein PC122_g7245 [Phytophthora cactorum]KAG3196902.1 hypothetical protein PC128_g7266 [Phytophthora cactorum]